MSFGELERRLRRRMRSEAEAHDLEEEMALHRELRARQIAADRDVSSEEATALACRAFGNRTALLEEANAVWTSMWLEDLWKDIRHAGRAMWSHPLFTTVAVLTLALGVGANTAIFSIMNALLLRTLPVPNGERVYRVSCDGQPKAASDTGDSTTSFSYAVSARLRAARPDIAEVMAYVPLGFNKISVRTKSVPQEASAHMVSGNFFTGLQAPLACGRPLLPTDESSGAPVAVLNYGYATAKFGSACSAIGEKIFVRGLPFTIIGVTGARFDGVAPKATDIWIPFQRRPELNAWGMADSNFMADSKWWCLLMIARLKPGISEASAIAALTPSFEHAAYEPFDGRLQPGEKRTQLHLKQARGFVATPEERHRFLVIQAMVAMLLLIACGNVSMLLSVRNASRVREFSVKRAIGGSNLRLFRQLLTESGLLVFLGTLLGIAFAFIWTQALAAWAEIDIHATPDRTVLSVTLAVSIVAAVLFGIAPAIRTTRMPLAESMKTSAASSLHHRAHLPPGSLISLGQLAFSLALLVSTVLLVRTLQNLEHVRLGLDTEGLVVFGISPPSNRTTNEQTVAFYRELTDRLRALPQVTSVTLSGNRLGSGWSNNTSAIVDNKYVQASPNYMRWNDVGPAFFQTLGIPLLQGRDFNDSDAQGSPHVVVVSRLFAEKYLPGGNPIGHTASFTMSKQFTIVGVAEDNKYTAIQEDAMPMAWFPYSQAIDVGVMHFELRARGDLAAVLSAARRAVAAVAPDSALLQPRTQQAEFRKSIDTQLLIGRLSLSFSVLAAFLVAIGLYGTTSYNVSRRFRELGVRMAIGANRGRILRGVLGSTLILCAISLALGLPLAFWMAHVLKSVLFGVAATDVASFVAAAAGLFAISVAASYLPARRASVIDPSVALRYE